MQAYLLWHPLDHVGVTLFRGPTGRLGVGDRLHITEVFARDPRFPMDQDVRVHRWDANGVGFHAVIGGFRGFNLDGYSSQIVARNHSEIDHLCVRS